MSNKQKPLSVHFNLRPVEYIADLILELRKEEQRTQESISQDTTQCNATRLNWITDEDCEKNTFVYPYPFYEMSSFILLSLGLFFFFFPETSEEKQKKSLTSSETRIPSDSPQNSASYFHQLPCHTQWDLDQFMKSENRQKKFILTNEEEKLVLNGNHDHRDVIIIRKANDINNVSERSRNNSG